MRKKLYAAVARVANAARKATRRIDRHFPEGAFQPKWAPSPLPKARERSFPPLGFPRQTDSLCPGCVKEVRAQILSGEADWKVLIEGRPGEIPAQIVEEGGRILMRKDCP